MLTEEKAALRRELLSRRAALSEGERGALESGVCKHLAGVLRISKPDLALLYAAVRGELDIFPLAEWLLSEGVAIAFPRSERGGVMYFHTVSALRDLGVGLYGIPSPSEDAPPALPTERSICIVPALAYDRAGYRLGYGGGYYDRFLRGFPGKTIGIAPDYAIYDELPRGEHDLPVSMLVTERGVLVPAESGRNTERNR